MTDAEYRFGVKISDADKGTFDEILNVARGKYGNAELALLSVEYDEKPMTAVCIVSQDDPDASYSFTPVALIVTEEMASRLVDPMGRPPGAD